MAFECRRTAGVVCFALMAAAWLGATPRAEAARLHVVIATDRSAREIAGAMKVNMEAIEKVVSDNVPEAMCNFRKLPLISEEQGQLITPINRNTVLGTIASLDVAPGDSILVFYSGHGAYDPARGTYATIAAGQGGVLFLSELRQAMTNKDPRTAVLIMDCCNASQPVGGRPAPVLPAPFHPEQISPLFDELFFRQGGTYVITSSAPGQYALIWPKVVFPDGGSLDRGSLFTTTFTTCLSESSEDRMSWQSLCRKTQAAMDEFFPTICRNGVIVLSNGLRIPQNRQTIDFRVYE
jgi:Caspase domain